MLLEIKNDNVKDLAKYWLSLAVLSVAFAGLYSLPPVVLRGSYFANLLNVEHIFATALVIHVDLSVLVWFLSIYGMLCSFLASDKYISIYKAIFSICALGALIITISPFLGHANPVKNNYIPVLQNHSFFIGLSLFLIGIFANSIVTLLEYKKIKKNYLHLGIYISSIITLMGAVCFILSFMANEYADGISLKDYYEQLFWGGGHVLQFTYTTIMLVCWIFFASIIGCDKYLSQKFVVGLLLINLLVVLISPLFYLLENSYSLFTLQMRYAGGISALFIGFLIVMGFVVTKFGNKTDNFIKSSMILSIILFGYGGFLGYAISGVNVTIPAHYHGSIVAVTLSFMGLIYYFYPKVGLGEVKGKLANIQPYIYAFGQIMHITGLAWMGGYGALRKSVASSGQVTNIIPKIMFFTGGAMAILGGLLFVIVLMKAYLKRNK